MMDRLTVRTGFRVRTLRAVCLALGLALEDVICFPARA